MNSKFTLACCLLWISACAATSGGRLIDPDPSRSSVGGDKLPTPDDPVVAMVGGALVDEASALRFTLPEGWTVLSQEGEGILGAAQGPHGVRLELRRWDGRMEPLRAEQGLDPVRWAAEGPPESPSGGLPGAVAVATRPGDEHATTLQFSWFFRSESAAVELRATLPRATFESSLRSVVSLLSHRGPGQAGTR